MFRLFLFVLVLCLLISLTESKKTTKEIIEAFEKDGYTIKTQVEFKGQRGFYAAHKTATTLSTKQPKYVLYVEGSGYEMGYLRGMLTKNQTVQMFNDYLLYVVPELISFDLVEKYRNKPWFRAFMHLLKSFLITSSTQSFKKSIDAHPTMFPKSLIDEMKGIVDSLQKQGVKSVTMDKAITLNYGVDWMMTNAYTGFGFIKAVKEFLLTKENQQLQYHKEFMHVLNTEKKLFEPTVACDAFGIKGKATKSGEDIFFGRDFQLKTGRVFQNVNLMIIYHPTDGRNSIVSATAPGLVGSITALNTHGYTMAVDILRSAAANQEHPGLNSIMLIRTVADNVRTTRQAIQFISNSLRGTPWLYPMCDITGDCVVIEAGKHEKEESNPLKYVPKGFPKSILPTSEFLKQYSQNKFSNGIYIREMNWKLNKKFLDFNKKLFEYFQLNATAFEKYGKTDEIFDKFQEESVYAKKGFYYFFSPQREELDDVIITTNLAVVPEMRITQMSPLTSMMQGGSKGMQYRYDRINKMILENYGKIDWEYVRNIITRLSPDRTPGFWSNYWDPNDPMTAEIEGQITIVDIKKRIIEMKGGYWTDDFIKLQLLNYS
eukprot:gene7861-12332_t